MFGDAVSQDFSFLKAWNMGCRLYMEREFE